MSRAPNRLPAALRFAGRAELTFHLSPEERCAHAHRDDEKYDRYGKTDIPICKTLGFQERDRSEASRKPGSSGDDCSGRRIIKVEFGWATDLGVVTPKARPCDFSPLKRR